ncbi:hypothetical protein ALP54_101623 [Pseudomonas amygdali pv. lachrymans]|nr:hypothetical protein ALP54_101623 [Pseudomonas amygdali pv. lachrymans]
MHQWVRIPRGLILPENKKPPRPGGFFISTRYENTLTRQKNKNPQRVSDEGFWNLILTMTYSHMGKPHTTIGDTSFHY